MSYPSQGLFPRWPWLISFTDLSDEVVKKLGDNKLVGCPDPTLITIPANSSLVVTDSSIMFASPTDPAGAGKLTITNANLTQSITVSQKNYYYNTAKGLIDFAQTKGIDEAQLNATVPCHYQIAQWQIAFMHWKVCADNVGLNDNVPLMDDKYNSKTKLYYAECMRIQTGIRMEMFYTAAMQQNQTRDGCGQFLIRCG